MPAIKPIHVSVLDDGRIRLNHPGHPLHNRLIGSLESVANFSYLPEMKPIEPTNLVFLRELLLRDVPADARTTALRVLETIRQGLEEIATTSPDAETQVGPGTYARTVQVKARELLGLSSSVSA